MSKIALPLNELMSFASTSKYNWQQQQFPGLFTKAPYYGGGDIIVYHLLLYFIRISSSFIAKLSVAWRTCVDLLRILRANHLLLWELQLILKIN